MMQFQVLSIITDLMCPGKNIIARNYQSLMIVSSTSTKRVYVAGDNTHSRLGTSSQQTNNMPMEIKMLRNVEVISEGLTNERHTFIYTQDDQLYVSGKDNGSRDRWYSYFSGYLGIEKVDPYKEYVLKKLDVSWLATKSGKMAKIIDIKCSKTRSLFLTNKGNVFGCGTSTQHLSNGKDGKKWKSMKDFGPTPNQIQFGKDAQGKLYKISKIAIGGLGSEDNNELLFVTTSGILLIQGNTGYLASHCFGGKETVGRPTEHPFFTATKINVVDVEAGEKHFVVIADNADCYTFGMNACGQCGDGFAYSEQYDPETVSYGPHLSTQQNRDRDSLPLYCVETPYKLMNDVNDHDLPLKIEQVSCGNIHTVLLTKDNRIFTMGNNYSHQCSTINEDEIVTRPYWFRKELELGISEESVCTMIRALNYGTLIGINGC